MVKTKVDIGLNEFLSEQLSFDIGATEKKSQMGSNLTIEEIVGEIEPGIRRFGLTAGQFSLSDLITYILAKTGPADLYLSTWAASADGLRKAFDFLKNGEIRSIKFLIDTGAKKYRNAEFGALLDKFGDCVRTTRIHAKFVVIRNEKFDFVIRTSANLNKNTRLETFEIDEDKAFADFFQRFFDIAFEKIPVKENHTLKSSQKLKPILDHDQDGFTWDNHDFMDYQQCQI